MALIVEDGTGRADAEAYDSVANATAIIARLARSSDVTAWNALSDANKEGAMRRGAAFQDRRFAGRLTGTRHSREQALDWPRDNGVDRDGFAVPSGSIPREVKVTNALLALRASTEDFDAGQVAGTATGGLKAERLVVGPLEIEEEYEGGSTTAATYEQVDEVMRPLLVSGGDSIILTG